MAQHARQVGLGSGLGYPNPNPDPNPNPNPNPNQVSKGNGRLVRNMVERAIQPYPYP